MRSTAVLVKVRARECEETARFAEELWNEDDLLTRLVGALDFAEGALRQIEHGLPAAVDEERLIAETGVLLLAASNVASYAAIGPRIHRVASLLVPHARSARTLRRICLEPGAALEHATAHICLNRLDFYDADFDAMLDLSVAAQASEGRERAPHRMLEQEWLRHGWLYPEGLARLRWGAHMAHCVLSRPIDLLHGTREEIQSFVRALRCLRDLNLFPRPLPRAREELLAEAEGMLARCLAEADYDLAAEVLLAWPLTGRGWSAASAFGFRVVMAASGMQSSGLAEYHGVYGIGMLCAASLALERRPPVRVSATAVRQGFMEAVAACLAFDDGAEEAAGWRRELARMEAAEREALASFLLCIALQRGFARRDFGAMERVLEVGRGLGVVPCPAGKQAAELLVRVSRCALMEVAAEVQEREVCLC